MLCILMIAGGYVLLPVANTCDDPRCVRVVSEAGRVLSRDELPSWNWIRSGDHPLLFCLSK
jgi:hypothetical protein